MNSLRDVIRALCHACIVSVVIVSRVYWMPQGATKELMIFGVRSAKNLPQSQEGMFLIYQLTSSANRYKLCYTIEMTA